MSYSVKILLDSVAPCGKRLTTFELTYPRFIHSELMTHRVFSRNAASSRAIPVKKMMQNIKDNPVIPLFWGKNQSGMQAKEELSDNDKHLADIFWNQAKDYNLQYLEYFNNINLHKQISNRIIEPWMFITVILSGTTFDNFFKQRNHDAAQPEIQWVAKNMAQAYHNSSPNQLADGEWHLPLLSDKDSLKGVYDENTLKKISAGRVARVSYLNHDGSSNPEKDIELCNKLVEYGHWSPLEHIAQAMSTESWNEHFMKICGGDLLDHSLLGNFVGWKQFRKEFNV